MAGSAGWAFTGHEPRVTRHSVCRYGAMPVHRAGMMEAPVHRDPAGPPGFQVQLVGTNDVARVVEDVEELPGEDFPIAVEERAAQMFGQGFERAAVAGIEALPEHLRRAFLDGDWEIGRAHV